MSCQLQAQVKLGRIAGISVGLHYSWFIIALLITLSLADHFHSVTPEWRDAVVWSAAVVTGLLFFAALLLHELAHSVVAKSRGLRVRAITLFALGGVSQIESEASDAKSEFWIAIVGPLTEPGILRGCTRLKSAALPIFATLDYLYCPRVTNSARGKRDHRHGTLNVRAHHPGGRDLPHVFDLPGSRELEPLRMVHPDEVQVGNDLHFLRWRSRIRFVDFRFRLAGSE